MTSHSDLTTTARQVLRLPRQDRLGFINVHPDPEALKQEIIRLWTPHKNYRVYLRGRSGSIPMLPMEGATLDEALAMAQYQFGAAQVVRVITGEAERNDRTHPA